MKKCKILLFLFLLTVSAAYPQIDFNIEDYKAFLNSHQNMTSGDLLAMHPAGVFSTNLNSNYDDAIYFHLIDSIYNLTSHEKELIRNNGFMVTERLSRESFGQALLEIYHNDLPVYISSDAILHSLHKSYDRILKDVELGLLISRINGILSAMHQNMPQLAARYSSNPLMTQKLKDVDVYLTVAKKLLNLSGAPYYEDNSGQVLYYINKVNEAAGLSYENIFSENCRPVDWSQFKPRGHYVDEHYPQLANYFRCMMWLGRIELYLIEPKNVYPLCVPDFYDVQRQTIMSMLIKELYEFAGVQSSFEQVEDILKFFVGESDNVTMPNLFYLQDALQINHADELLDSLTMVRFGDTLSLQSFANQKILSQVLYSDPMSPDSIVPASAFLLFGQRFVIDSYVMASVVYDRILYNNEKVCRLYPSTLDPLFAVGNDAAAQLLIPELNNFHYSTNLAALRYLVDSYGSDFWESSIYNSWLYGIKKLNPVSDRTGLPPYMSTAAFWQKQMNTQLSSWTELRHDNLLYAKPSYTGGVICSFPYTYVEPFPDFYGALKILGAIGKNKFQTMNFPDEQVKARIIEYFNDLGTISDTLKSITSKELNGIPFTPEEQNFLRTVLFLTPWGCTDTYAGWYARLNYNDDEWGNEMMRQDYLVADVHTVPTDCDGNSLGAVVHVGTGPINLGVFIAPAPGGINAAYIGPAASYYDYRTLNYQRLTDEEWKLTYLNMSGRPAWVNIYLADSLGNNRGYGPSLITGVKDQGNIVPGEFQFVKNYPNPFNPSTTIAFNVPAGLSFRQTEVAVYNIQGELIKTLFKGELPEGHYLLKWEGNSNTGVEVSSGVYICKVTTGDNSKSLKMTLLK